MTQAIEQFAPRQIVLPVGTPPYEPVSLFTFMIDARASQMWSAMACGHAVLESLGLTLRFVTPTEAAAPEQQRETAIATFRSWLASTGEAAARRAVHLESFGFIVARVPPSTIRLRREHHP
jgi:ABC-type Fe2+-enterobactin transport system substrate-binding protein